MGIGYLQSNENSFGHLGVNLPAVADGIPYGVYPLWVFRCRTPASVSWEEKGKNEIGGEIKFVATANMRFIGSTSGQDHVGCNWNTSDRDIPRVTECVKDIGI